MSSEMLWPVGAGRADCLDTDGDTVCTAGRLADIAATLPDEPDDRHSLRRRGLVGQTRLVTDTVTAHSIMRWAILSRWSSSNTQIPCMRSGGLRM